MRPKFGSRSSVIVGSLLLVACGGSVPQPRTSGVQGERPSPLGQSYTLNPLPSDDESLLGRVLDRPPAAGQSLEEVARPNPCAEKLTDAKTLPSVATFDDAEELAVGGKASATLGTFGFSGDASRATHFVYKLETEKRASRVDTAEYEACCKEKGCGYGFVSALVYGSGEYATAEETSGSGGVNIAFAKAEGTASLKILHKRNVKGWVAALIRVTDQSKAPGALVGALGDPSAYGVKIDADTLPDQVKTRYATEQFEVVGVSENWVFSRAGVAITENEFAEKYTSLTNSSDLDGVKHRRNSGRLVLASTALALSGGVLAVGLTHLSRQCDSGDSERDADAGSYAYDGSGLSYSKATSGCRADPASSVKVQIDPGSGTGTKTGICKNDADCFVDSRKSTTNVFGVALAIGGGVATVASGIWVYLEWIGHDGAPGDHVLTQPDARLFAQKYNRVLLNKTVKETENRIRSLSSSGRGMRGNVRVWPVLAPTFIGAAGSF